jgi:eukaryotic-like serine/threonine-protein kinase
LAIVPPPPPPRPKSKVSGLFGIASGLGGAAPASLRGKVPKSQPPPPLRYVPGGVIGEKYRLTRVLGEGGMGAVWVARNLRLDVDVAIKLIRREVAAEDTSDRLLQEARAAARIGHPSIVRVYDFGETEYKDPYIVMELLEGESLRQVLDRKARLPAVNAVQTVLPVVSALVAAHGKGIIHRDIKPENILLAEDERGVLVPKIVDFGIAKLRRDVDENRKQTQAGSVVGSPDYMSPEQARGRADIDERSDVWSMCVVIYEVVTGTCPFVGDNYHAQLRAIIEESPTPIAEYDVGDDELWTILSRGLEKDKTARWPTMRALGGALAAWCVAKDVEADVSGALLSLEWAEAVAARRPLSEPPQSLAEARAATLSQRASSDPSRDESASNPPPRSLPRVEWPARAQRETLPADAPPPSSRRGPPPLPPSITKETRVSSASGAPAPSPPEPVEAAPTSAPPVEQRVSLSPGRSSFVPAPPPDRSGKRSRRTRVAPPKSRWPLALFAVALAGVGGLVVMLATPLGEAISERYGKPAPTIPTTPEPPRPSGRHAASTATTASDVEPSPSSNVAAPASASPGASAAESASPSASASAGAHVFGSVAACMQADFADDSIDGGSAARLASLCAEVDPRKGATAMKTEVVRAGSHRVSEAMREWALLSWYELAAFAIIRADCCPDVTPLKLPAVGQCDPLDGALDATSAAVTTGGDVEGAVGLFKKAISCVTVSGASNNFTYPALSGGEETAFKKTLARVAKHH